MNDKHFRYEHLPDYPILKHFRYEHLPEGLAAISKPFAEHANEMATLLPRGPEVLAGLRKLLEAKDCFVRAALAE